MQDRLKKFGQARLSSTTYAQIACEAALGQPTEVILDDVKKNMCKRSGRPLSPELS